VVNDIDWRETHILLKAAFDLSASSPMATYEIPYGTIQRPTTRNNSWEKAKFEVPAIRWADLGNDQRGFSLINESKYGYDAAGNTLRISHPPSLMRCLILSFSCGYLSAIQTLYCAADYVGVRRILIHQLRRRPKCPLHYVYGLRPRPQPRRVDMRVSSQVKRHLLQERLQRCQLSLRLAQRVVERLGVAAIQRL
jgi:hypothetical protein